MEEENTPLYSSHIFMFPFRFDWNEDGFKHEFEFYKENSIEKRLNFNLNTIKDRLSDWSYEPFNLKKDLDNHKDYMYNEFAYFYDYARDALYNQSNTEDEISYYFEKKFDDATYEIKVKNRDKPYVLTIDGISLRLFSSGVALLAIELKNNNSEQRKFKDILKINDFGRRIYPQYIANGSSEATKGSFLADSIKIRSSNENISCIENFCFTPSDDIAIGRHIMKILGDGFTQNKQETKKYYIQPLLDDRMFVLSWYGNGAISAELKQNNHYKKSDDWYEYIFVDGNGVTVKNTQMKKRLLKKSTYARWSEYGTFWGISRYSMVALTNSKSSWVSKHLDTMYFQMVTLLLATRASILRFSDEVAALASPNSDLDTDKLTKLYQRYLVFYNRLYFKEVTHQEQGIELYTIARKQMNIDEHVKKLDKKFSKLFEFAKIQSDDESNAILDKLTYLGAIFLPPSLMVALFSMGIFDYRQSVDTLNNGLFATLLSGLLGIVGIWLLSRKKKFRKFLDTSISIIFTILFICLVYISLHHHIGEKENKTTDINTTLTSKTQPKQGDTNVSK
jgi:hypothetical protein